MKNTKQLSSPLSTGGVGGHFESYVQASFVVLMLTDGRAPCLPTWPIVEIKLQGRVDGYKTDDLIVFVEQPGSKTRCKLLCEIKYSIAITQQNKTFSDVIQAAWNDFNNADIFNRGRDVIALATHHLNETDFRNVQWLLDQARYQKENDFYRNVKQANFSPPKSSEKLDVFRHHIKQANNNRSVSDGELYSFLRHFYILEYDLGREQGVNLSLLLSHIAQFKRQYPQNLWDRVVGTVQKFNKNAGAITRENLPDDLQEAFKQPAIEHIPAKFVPSSPPTPPQIGWNQHQYAADLALANLIGAWNEGNQADIKALEQILPNGYSAWITNIRALLQDPNSPISLQNGAWKINLTVQKRISLWNALGSQIFDENLDAFTKLALPVLTERNPGFEFAAEERYMASVHGKVLTHSTELRQGLAESLALLGTRYDKLTHCAIDKRRDTAALVIRDIFTDADWQLWGSLDRLLPTLAEAAPERFLDAVEKALSLDPCPFDRLFADEGHGIFGRSYITGLLWALEALAWDKEHLVRVCVIFADLANHDPGGQWMNRPANSLWTILLPWRPQTTAPFEKRKVAIQKVRDEFPNIAWKLILGLLPGHQTSTGSHKPSWRAIIPNDWKSGTTVTEYSEQVSFYSELAVSMACDDTTRLVEIMDNFNRLPDAAFTPLVEALSSETLLALSENERFPVWEKLREQTSRHRHGRSAEAKWAMSDERISRLENATDQLAPSNPANLFQHLFRNSDADIYEKSGNFKERSKEFDERRQKALKEILNLGGIEAVIDFAKTVEAPYRVGCALGYIATVDIDKALLPTFLDSEDHNLSQFINGYVWSRQQTQSWSWVDALDKSDWSTAQIGTFLSYLPFTNGVWERATEWLGSAQGEYWQKVNIRFYLADDDLSIAVDKLIEHGRPFVAIECLSMMRHSKQLLSLDQCVKTLLATVSSSEPPELVNVYELVKLIKQLQASPEVNHDDLFQVEWAYLPLLVGGHNGTTPKLLENRMATDPEFFHEMVSLVYRSNKSDRSDKPSDGEKETAECVYGLLREWRTPPGMQEDGRFVDSDFVTWLKRVKEICTESGRLEVALSRIGEVLIHCPKDPGGLWINSTVAAALNAKDAEEMRYAFNIALRNTRGVYQVDPTGAPERELADKYRRKAEEVENAGYQRFATSLRELSDSYKRDAERVIAEHQHDNAL